MDLLKKFQQYIREENLFRRQDRLLLAVSGGVDSVVMCELCKLSGFNFMIAHCNFQLRSSESDADEIFVKTLAEKYGAEIIIKKFNTCEYAKEHKLGIQEAARDLRYEWFAEQMSLPSLKPVKYLLTAHHADDHIETILMNFFRGSGIKGLKGILPRQGHIIRPLLFAKKELLQDFAKAHNLLFREDSSNSSDKYTRNYFRNQLIPGLEKIFPQVKENLLNNASRFNDINLLYSISAENIIKKLVVRKGSELHLPVLKLLKTPALRTIIFGIIKDYGFSSLQADEVIRLLNAESGKYIQSATHRVLRNRAWLIISPLNHYGLDHYVIEENDQHIIFTRGKLSIEKIKEPIAISSEANTAMIDSTDVKFPLLLRKWKQGDYFYPLGMQKKKKLSRFFIDKKLSLNEKENIWVIESNKKIVWVIGHRIDDRFKITANTQGILKFIFSPSEQAGSL